MSRWLYGLLIFVPATVVAELLGLSPSIIFGLAALSLIPLAYLIGRATEALAHHLGPRYGGLLNATFGNAAELIITAFAVNRGLLTLVKASITGSIIGNLLLILGLSLFAGGVRHSLQQFDARRASLNSAMMILAVAALYLPATFAATMQEQDTIINVSEVVSIVLLLTYAAYLRYTMLSDQRQRASSKQPPANEAQRQHSDNPEQSESGSGSEQWSTQRALLVLTGAMAGTALSSELLVRAVEPVTRDIGLSEFFVGIIIVPLVGNAAEHFSAVVMAWRNRLEISLSIVAGSSTQIALLVAPALVFLSLLLGHPMDLLFSPLELVILGLATLIFAYISIDGESNWLEGVQLLALYLIMALVLFFIPVQG